MTDAPQVAAEGGCGYMHDRFTAYVDYMRMVLDQDPQLQPSAD